MISDFRKDSNTQMNEVKKSIQDLDLKSQKHAQEVQQGYENSELKTK
jgi:hypothetical protein